MNTTEKLIERYLLLSGKRKYSDFAQLHIEVIKAKEKENPNTLNYHCLEFVGKKLVKAIQYCLENKGSITVEIMDTIETIEKGYKKKSDPSTKKGDLGKLVDHGKVTPRGNADLYWKRKGIDLVFLPNDKAVRVGSPIPETYKYSDMRFLEDYYGLRAFEFGNWLSQQDRLNYLSGLGLALYDLHKALGFAPEKISIKNRLGVAFGARGRGKALAHFEPGSFTINLTRYSRPPQEDNRSSDFKRVNLILRDGGVGAFAHEYGHALDYYGALHVEKGDTWSLSRDDSVNPKPDPVLLKKNTLRGLMEKLMYKIIWKSPDKFTPYYERLIKGGTKKYYKQRNEIFARAFEVYVHYKLDEKKYKNVFLNKTKYTARYYMTVKEMKRVINEFDKLINALKKHL